MFSQAIKEMTVSIFFAFVQKSRLSLGYTADFFFKSFQFTKSQQKLKTEAFDKRFKEISLLPEFKPLFFLVVQQEAFCSCGHLY